jgi:hypothetical protein
MVGVATRCPAIGLLAACLLVACLVWELDVSAPLIRRLGCMHEARRICWGHHSFVPLRIHSCAIDSTEVITEPSHDFHLDVMRNLTIDYIWSMCRERCTWRLESTKVGVVAAG